MPPLRDFLLNAPKSDLSAPSIAESSLVGRAGDEREISLVKRRAELRAKIIISACAAVFLSSGTPAIAGCEDTSFFVERYLAGIPSLRTSDEGDSEVVADSLMGLQFAYDLKDIECVNIGDQQRIVSALAETYRDDRFHVRMNALRLVRDFKTQAAFDLILAGLDDQHEFVKFVAAESLFLVRKPEAIAPLIEMLRNDRSAIARGGAAFALAGYQSEDVTDALIYALLNDDDSDVRAFSANALGFHLEHFPPRSARVAAALEEALNDSDETVRRRAGNALEQ